MDIFGVQIFFSAFQNYLLSQTINGHKKGNLHKIRCGTCAVHNVHWLCARVGGIKFNNNNSSAKLVRINFSLALYSLSRFGPCWAYQKSIVYSNKFVAVCTGRIDLVHSHTYNRREINSVLSNLLFDLTSNNTVVKLILLHLDGWMVWRVMWCVRWYVFVLQSTSILLLAYLVLCLCSLSSFVRALADPKSVDFNIKGTLVCHS